MTDWRALCAELVGAIQKDTRFWEEELMATADRARAALAQPAPPAVEEVAELVAALNKAVDGTMAMGWEDAAQAIIRAADLLERQQPVPVPVSERLTVQEIDNLPEHRASYIYEGRSGVIQVEGCFTRAELRQLADSIPTHTSENG